MRWDWDEGASAGSRRHDTRGAKKKELGWRYGMGRLVVAALGELVITAPERLVIAVPEASHQDGGGAGERHYRSAGGAGGVKKKKERLTCWDERVCMGI